MLHGLPLGSTEHHRFAEHRIRDRPPAEGEAVVISRRVATRDRCSAWGKSGPFGYSPPPPTSAVLSTLPPSDSHPGPRSKPHRHRPPDCRAGASGSRAVSASMPGPHPRVVVALAVGGLQWFVPGGAGVRFQAAPIDRIGGAGTIKYAWWAAFLVPRHQHVDSKPVCVNR